MKFQQNYLTTSCVVLGMFAVERNKLTYSWEINVIEFDGGILTLCL